MLRRIYEIKIVWYYLMKRRWNATNSDGNAFEGGKQIHTYTSSELFMVGEQNMALNGGFPKKTG